MRRQWVSYLGWHTYATYVTMNYFMAKEKGMFSWTSVLPLLSLWGFYIRLNNIKGQFGVSDDLKQPLLWPYFLAKREAGKKFEQDVFIRIFMLVKIESILNLDLI